MLRSMTAYGRGSAVTRIGRFVVEIQSINKRHFELLCQLPASLILFEAKVRSLLAGEIHRGQLLYRLRVVYTEATPIQLTVDMPLLHQLKGAWQHVATTLGHDPSKPLPLELFAQRQDLLIQEERVDDEASLWLPINDATAAALQQLLCVKGEEGMNLATAIRGSHQQLLTLLADVKALLPDSSVRYRERLEERLRPILPENLLTDERMLRELCLFAEKSDVSEEVVRLESHLRQCIDLLDSEKVSVGKQFEFLLQEISREINTLGAKSSDIALIQRILAMKGEVEKIREQVQNIE